MAKANTPIHRIFLASGTGNGKSTFAETFSSLHSTVLLCNNVSSSSLAETDERARQRKLTTNLWLQQCTTYESSGNHLPVRIYDRSVFDYVDANRRSTDPVVRMDATDRVKRTIYNPEPVNWDGVTIVIAPTPTLPMIKKMKDDLLGNDKRGNYWRDLITSKYGEVSQTAMLEYIHEEMVASRTWIKAMTDVVAAKLPSSVYFNVIDVESWSFYNRHKDFYSWQRDLVPALEPVARLEVGKPTA